MLLKELRPLKQIDKKLKMFDFQFYVNSKDHIPTNLLRRKEPEKPVKTKKRSKRNTGCEIMSSRMAGTWYYVSVQKLINDLFYWGYKLVDGFYQKRPSKRGNGYYYIVRFTFARHEIVGEYYSKNSPVDKALSEMASPNWQFKLYLNPFYKDGKEIDKNYSMSAKFLNLTYHNRTLFDLVAQGHKVRQIVSSS